MRKKELEEKIDDLEALIDDLVKRQSAVEFIIKKDLGIEIYGCFPQTDLGMAMSGLTSHEYCIRREKSILIKLEDKINEHEKILRETILPYIDGELTTNIMSCFDDLSSIINGFIKDTESKPAKNVKKDTEKPAKNVGKKTTKKKESK